MSIINYDKKAIGSRIRNIRLNKGMTLEEFGSLFNASKVLFIDGKMVHQFLTLKDLKLYRKLEMFQ